jgi:predicted enzyme related to lactoylglutathione lyase
VVNGPLKWDGRGSGILLADPGGAHFLVLNAGDGDPKDHPPMIGDWLWDETWTLQAERDASFYKELIPYERVLKGEGYSVLINEGKWRAGVRNIWEEAFAGRWVPVVRVEDPLAMTNRVEELGGKVWIPPEDEQRGKGTLLISDPAGALLILQAWELPKPGKEVAP